MIKIKRIITKSNSAELELLLKKFNSLVDELKETSEKIVDFKLELTTGEIINEEEITI